MIQPTLFKKPSDFIYNELHVVKPNSDGEYFMPLQRTLGWVELECDVWNIINHLASTTDDWLSPIDSLYRHQSYWCGIGEFERKSEEYFPDVDGKHYLSLEVFLKIHRARDNDPNTEGII